MIAERAGGNKSGLLRLVLFLEKVFRDGYWAGLKSRFLAAVARRVRMAA